MKLIVKNFGPIEDACIDVKPLTVFAGPGNRGKSYLATLLHTIMQSGDIYDFVNLQYFKILREILKLGKTSDDKTSDNQLIPLIDKLLTIHFKRFSEIWHENMDYYFGEINEALLKNKPHIRVTSNDGNTVVDLMTPKRSRFHQGLNNTLLQNLKKYLNSPEAGEGLSEFISRSFVSKIAKVIHKEIGFPYNIDKDTYYLPAVRSGIMQSRLLMVDRLTKRVTFAGMREQEAIPSFHGIFADFLNDINGIDKRTLRFAQNKDRQTILQLADNVETQMLEGKVKVTLSPTGTPDFSYAFTQENKKHDIPLMHSSSTVSELSPFVLFLRYHLEKGDFLIFEEPEAHLHPAAQQHFTTLLVHLMQQGVNVLITTHSSIIPEQLGNCVFAQRLIKKYTKKNPDKIEQIRKKYPIALSAPLKETDAIAYDFVRPPKNGRGTIVKHIPYDLVTDYLPENHYDVSNELIKEGSTLQTIYDDESIDP